MDLKLSGVEPRKGRMRIKAAGLELTGECKKKGKTNRQKSIDFG